MNIDGYAVAMTVYKNSYDMNCDCFDFNYIRNAYDIIVMLKNDDDEFMCDFYDGFRNHAIEDSDFEKALIDSEVMEYEDIYGL